jgi:GDP-D-mannose 3',5'-epimerase
MKTACVFGAGGFIGNHLVYRLKKLGYYVKGVDLCYPQYSSSVADDFQVLDLREVSSFPGALQVGPLGKMPDEVYQLAADMGGAGYIFSRKYDADIMSNSVRINLNLLNTIKDCPVVKVFFSSSACVYPEYNQVDPQSPNCAESSVYPALPDSEYGWEKLFSERLYLAHHMNYGVNVRIARFHNIFGPFGAWNNGREKAPSAICRKVAQAPNGGNIEIWGDGQQTRSFLYIDECLDGVLKLMESDFTGPVNIGSEQMVSINELVDMVCRIAGKTLNKVYIKGPMGVRGRNSDNKLIFTKLGWKPTMDLESGLRSTFSWISKQLEKV